MPLFLILRYFGPNLVVVASDGLLGALWRLFSAFLTPSGNVGCKIAHSFVSRPSDDLYCLPVGSMEEDDGANLSGQHSKKARQNRVEGSAVPVGGEELGSVRVR